MKLRLGNRLSWKLNCVYRLIQFKRCSFEISHNSKSGFGYCQKIYSPESLPVETTNLLVCRKGGAAIKPELKVRATSPDRVEVLNRTRRKKTCILRIKITGNKKKGQRRKRTGRRGKERKEGRKENIFHVLPLANIFSSS